MTAHDRFSEMLARRSELSAKEEAQLREHLGDCPDCRETAADYSRQTALLRSLPVVDPPPALRTSVLSGIPRYSPPAFWRRPSTVFAPLAAALLLVAGVLGYLNRPHSSSSPSAFSRQALPSATPVIPALDNGIVKPTSTPKQRATASGHAHRRATATPVSGPSSSGQVALGPAPGAPQPGAAPTSGVSVTNGSSATRFAPSTGPRPGGRQGSTNQGSGTHESVPPTTVPAPGDSNVPATVRPAAPMPVPQPTSAPTSSTSNPIVPPAPTATPVAPAPPVAPTPTPGSGGPAVATKQTTPTPTPTASPLVGAPQPPPSATPGP
jgi:hypothetical protein